MTVKANTSEFEEIMEEQNSKNNKLSNHNIIMEFLF